jgi:hypothetical protein
MSGNQLTRKNESAPVTARKPFCKVCHDAGKPESEYTSHYVKSLPDKRTGICNVICPTLLNTECRFCYEYGHTTKFCPVLANKEKSKKKIAREEERRNREKPIQQITPKNTGGGFSALLDLDSDDEEKVITPKKIEDFPALGEPSKRVQSYASVTAKKPVTISNNKEQIQSNYQVLNTFNKMNKIDFIEKKSVFTPAVKPVFKPGSWMEDSSDEEDEDELYVDNSAW